MSVSSVYLHKDNKEINIINKRLWNWTFGFIYTHIYRIAL